MSWFEEMLEDDVCYWSLIVVMLVCGSMWVEVMIR